MKERAREHMQHMQISTKQNLESIRVHSRNLLWSPAIYISGLWSDNNSFQYEEYVMAMSWLDEMIVYKSWKYSRATRLIWSIKKNKNLEWNETSGWAKREIKGEHPTSRTMAVAKPLGSNGLWGSYFVFHLNPEGERQRSRRGLTCCRCDFGERRRAGLGDL